MSPKNEERQQKVRLSWLGFSAIASTIGIELGWREREYEREREDE